ncbi:uncharacterized protein LOC144695451 [Cetorhinus maximus]
MPQELEICEQLKNLLLNNTSTKVIGNAVLYLFLYGLEELLEKDIACPCATRLDNNIYAVLFFTLPSLLLFSISLLLQLVTRQWYGLCNNCAACKTIQSKSLVQIADSKTCTMRCCLLWGFMLVRLCFPSVIWMAVLFLDGDYFACAQLINVNYTVCAEFSCNEIPISLRSEIQHPCHVSRLTGALLLFITILTLIIFYYCHHQLDYDQREYCKKYDDVYANQEETMIMSKLTEEADKRAKVDFEEWRTSICNQVFSDFKTKQNTSGAGILSAVSDMQGQATNCKIVTIRNSVTLHSQQKTSPEAGGSLQGAEDKPHPSDEQLQPKITQHQVSVEKADVTGGPEKTSPEAGGSLQGAEDKPRPSDEQLQPKITQHQVSVEKSDVTGGPEAASLDVPESLPVDGKYQNIPLIPVQKKESESRHNLQPGEKDPRDSS